MDGVKGLILLSFNGDIILQEFSPILSDNIAKRDWRRLTESLAEIRESDLIFEKSRLYIRRTDVRFLVVLLGSFVPMAMLRLQCDILLPFLKPAKAATGIRRFFEI